MADALRQPPGLAVSPGQLVAANGLDSRLRAGRRQVGLALLGGQQPRRKAAEGLHPVFVRLEGQIPGGGVVGQDAGNLLGNHQARLALDDLASFAVGQRQPDQGGLAIFGVDDAVDLRLEEQKDRHLLSARAGAGIQQFGQLLVGVGRRRVIHLGAGGRQQGRQQDDQQTERKQGAKAAHGGFSWALQPGDKRLQCDGVIGRGAGFHLFIQVQ